MSSNNDQTEPSPQARPLAAAPAASPAPPVPVVRLTEVFRQAAASRIIVNAHRVNHGEMPELTVAADTPPDFYVVEIENDYDKDVYNGDIGFVHAIDAELGDVTIDVDGRHVLYAAHELDRVVLAYATTIHKAQGSEYPAVVIPVSTQHFPMLQRNLIYTGITRGRKLVVLVAQTKALAMAVRGQRSITRWSKLADWLR